MANYRERTEYQRQHYLKNKERKDAYAKKYREENREKALAAIAKCNKIWFQKNKQTIYLYRKDRLKNNIQCKIKETLRKRLKSAVKNEFKKGSAIELLGCSIEYFKEYISKQFKEGMSWENHGKTTWHIDHIIPCDKFDLTDTEQQKKCFNYTNMQPLLAVDNHKKGRKYYGKL